MQKLSRNLGKCHERKFHALMSNLAKPSDRVTWEAAYSESPKQKGVAASRFSHASRSTSSADLPAVEGGLTPRPRGSLSSAEGWEGREVLAHPKLAFHTLISGVRVFQTSTPSSPTSDNETAAAAMLSSEDREALFLASAQKKRNLRQHSCEELDEHGRRRHLGLVDAVGGQHQRVVEGGTRRETFGLTAEPCLRFHQDYLQRSPPRTFSCKHCASSVFDLSTWDLRQLLETTGATARNGWGALSVDVRVARAVELTKSMEHILRYFEESEHETWRELMKTLYVQKLSGMKLFSIAVAPDAADVAERAYRSNVDELLGMEPGLPGLDAHGATGDCAFDWVAGEPGEVGTSCRCCPNALQTCLSTTHFEETMMRVLDTDGKREFVRQRYYNGDAGDAYDLYVRNGHSLPGAVERSAR
jgi:hypothetical protein